MDRQLALRNLTDLDARRDKYPPVAVAFEQNYGRYTWRKRGTALDTFIGTILSQNTTDKNSGRAYEQLRERYETWQDVLDAPMPELIDTIRIAGLGNQKGPRIKAALQKIKEERGEFDLEWIGQLSVDDARTWMTAIDGIGLKTASIVVSFGFNGAAFAVDTHVTRVSARIGFTPPNSTPDKTMFIMEEIVPPQDYYAFHIQVIQHGRTLCRARNPLCDKCPIRTHCDYAHGLVKEKESAS
ncbi:MAG: endonuclease III domain-containing protein [Phototrophicaceae bacterium]